MAGIDDSRLQSSLGRIERFYRKDMKMDGFMSLARVTKVHHKSGTADVVLVNTGDTFTSSEDNEGRFSARILQRSSNFDESRNRYWGAIDPIAIGSLVLVAFLDSMKYRPIILGCFHRPDNYDNVYSSIYPLREKEAGFHRREALKKLSVSPSLTYKKQDGEGNIEVTFGSRSFFAVYNASADTQGNLNDSHEGFDHGDLSEIDKRTGEVLATDWEEVKTPSKFLFVHRNFENPTWTKFFINESGKLRITRDNNDEKLSFIEISETGRIMLKRQIESPYHNQGKSSEIILEENGEITFKHHSGTHIKFLDNGELEIKAKKLRVIEED